MSCCCCSTSSTFSSGFAEEDLASLEDHKDNHHELLCTCSTITISAKDRFGTFQVITQPKLPLDPRAWSRDEVKKWLDWMTSRHNLAEIDSTRFCMNGKALCLMNLPMFVTRVPLGGKLLYKDFQLRLHRSHYLEIMTLNSSR